MSINVFCCYARKDNSLLDELKAHLRPLEREGLIEVWYDGDINAGTEWETEIKEHMNAAQIVLLLISPDFMNSDYCYGIEMKQALERRARGEAEVIPIILRPVYWHGEPLGKLQALPKDGKPVTDPDWHNLDRAFYDVVTGIRKVLKVFLVKNLTLLRTLHSPADLFGFSSLAISPDGHLLISSGSTVKVWDLTTGKEIRAIHKNDIVWDLTTRKEIRAIHKNDIICVTINPNGQLLVSGSNDGTIKVWDLATGKEIRAILGHTNSILSLAISPGGQLLVSGSADKTIKIWNLATGKEIRTLPGHRDKVRCLAISPDEHLLASGSADKTIKIWNLATGKGLRTLSGHTGDVLSLAISPAGHLLASGNADKTIKIWNLATGKGLRTLSGHTGPILGVAISPDGLLLVSGSSDEWIKVWDLATGKEIRTLYGHFGGVTSVAISPNGQMLVSGGDWGEIDIWGA